MLVLSEIRYISCALVAQLLDAPVARPKSLKLWKGSVDELGNRNLKQGTRGLPGHLLLYSVY